MPFLLGLYIAAGMLMVALSIPLIRRQVGPNGLYGFRVRRTLEDPAVWYPANAYAAWGLLAVGLVTCLAAVVLYFVPGVDVPLYGLLLVAVVLGGLAVNVFLSFRYLGKLAGSDKKNDTAGHQG